MDAASSRGIDEIRALKEAVGVLPFKTKYKVYIIDEVHMLTAEAFNALLKTLEEPPEHVIFILATTEIDKVPDTIVSRSQHFEFRPIPEEDIQKMLEKIAKEEGIKPDAEALGIIAALSEGSLRDAEGILEQALAFSEKVTGEEVRRILGIPARELLEDFLLSLIAKDAKTALNIIHKAAEANVDIKNFTRLLIKFCRFLIYLKLDKGYEKEFAKFLSPQETSFLKMFAEKHELGDFENLLLKLSDAYPLFKFSYLPELPLELAVLKITQK